MSGGKFNLTGTRVGQFVIGERIGSGGMATVYRGVQPALNRDVAIKILPQHFSMDPTFVERFKQEAVSVANLRHPNILAVYDFGEQDGIIYMVSELVTGGTLADKLGTPWPIERTRAIMGPLASALDYAHNQGIVHRDLKPSNVLLTGEGEPVLSDFGLARLLQSQERLTASGAALGTPEYMSPEQAMGGVVGPSADIYAFGALLYEMLTGRIPFPGETPVAMILAHLHQTPLSPRSLVPTIPAAVERAVLKCLAKQAGDRFPTAQSVMYALEQAVADTAAPAAPSAAAWGDFSAWGIDPSQFPPDAFPAASASASIAPTAILDEPEQDAVEYGEVRVDLAPERLMWNGQGMERARMLLQQKLAKLKGEGWELSGSLRDSGVLQQVTSLRGATIRGAVLLLRRNRR